VEAVGNVLGGLAVLLGIAVLVVYLGLRKAIDRRRQLASYAAAQGWRYEREQPLLVDRFSGAPFGIGEARRAYNALFGSHHGRDLVAFDYEYETRTVDGKQTNQAFSVSCPDRRFASDVLHPRMMEFLLQYRQLGWRFEQDSMLVVAEGRRTPAQIEATIQVMDAITSLVPDFVWLRLKGQG
jgi:hypothetical protein